jgi:DNA-binding winged helix-turn-helix (wHTH) protein/TolB-like protein/Tfp pilus assembly protein PilF
MNASPKRFYEFGPFRIDTVKRQLLREGEPVALKSKCFETLLTLVEARGQVLDKDELMRRIWPDTIVEESNLTGYISTLRKALGENPQEHRYIVTVPGRGYSFVAEVKEVLEESAGLSSQEHPLPSLTAEEVEVDGSPEKEARSFPPLRRLSVFSQLSRPWRPKRLGIVAGAALLSLATITIAAVVIAYFLLPKNDKAIHSLAILPFTIDGNDPDLEPLAEGLANDLANRLSRLPELIVISSNAVARYKARGAAPDAQAIGREFKVEAVVVGKVEQRGDRIYIDVELIDARDNSHLWGEVKLTDIFSAQKDIANGISNRLRPGLTEKEQNPSAKRDTESIEAYRAYLKGRHSWNKRTEEGLREAIKFFDRAREVDPNCALAYAGLADSYQILAFHGALSPMEYFPMAKAAAEKAIGIDNNLAEAHTALAYMKYVYDWDWAGADAEFKQAIKLNPNYATAHQWYGEYLGQMGHFDEGLAERKKALRLDPLSPIITSQQGYSYLDARRYDSAIEEFRKASELYPDFSLAHDFLSYALALNGLYDDAIAERQKAITLTNDSYHFTGLAMIYAKSGRRVEAQKLLTEIILNSKNRYYPLAHIAAVYAALDDKDKAFQWLDKAYQRKDWAMVRLKVEPVFDSLRSDARFSELLKRMKLQ